MHFFLALLASLTGLCGLLDDDILLDSSAGELEGRSPVATDCCHRAPRAGSKGVL